MPSLERRRFLDAAAAVGVAVGAAVGAKTSVAADDDRIEWTADVDTGAIEIPAPTVVDGVVYVGGTDGTYAFDAKTGDEEWTFERQSEFGTPAVADGVVYVGGTETVYAIDAADGEEAWRFADDAEGVRAPSIAYGNVYVRTNDGTVYAIDADDGDEVWRFTEPTGEGYSVAFSSLTVADGTVYVASSDGVVYAIDAADGEIRWEFDEISGAHTTPTVADDTVYISHGSVYAVDVDSGDETWRASGVSNAVSSPTVVGDTVYAGRVIRPGADPVLYAIDADDGTVTREFSGNFAVVKNAPTVVDDTIFVANTHVGHAGANRVVAVDADNGDLRWTVLDVERPSEPIVVDGSLYVRDANRLYALDAGVEGSSEDSRALLGTYNHHHERAVDPDGRLDSRDRIDWLAENWWLPAGAGAGVLGAGAAYTHSKRNDESG